MSPSPAATADPSSPTAPIEPGSAPASAQPSPSTQPSAPTAPRRRISSLDALRGFAIAGILPLNMVMILTTDGNVPEDSLNGIQWTLFQVFVQMHFLPLFALLFGLTFGMMWRSGRGVRHRPRAALARRMLFLVLIGLPHQMLAPGESLLVFGVLGLLLLLPSTLLPPRLGLRVDAVLGTAGVIAAILGGPQVLLIGGLLLLGHSAGAAGLAGCWERPGGRRPLAVTAVVTGVLSAIGSALILTGAVDPVAPTSWGTPDLTLLTQLLMGTCFTAILLLAMRTRASHLLRVVFEPIGRCAMTCYVSASVVITVMSSVLGQDSLPLDAAGTWIILAASCLGILLLQNLTMRWCLDRWGRGPLEALSRRMTWWTRDGKPRLAANAVDAAATAGS